jgi:hypothetical protein
MIWAIIFYVVVTACAVPYAETKAEVGLIILWPVAVPLGLLLEAAKETWNWWRSLK